MILGWQYGIDYLRIDEEIFFEGKCISAIYYKYESYWNKQSETWNSPVKIQNKVVVKRCSLVNCLISTGIFLILRVRD